MERFTENSQTLSQELRETLALWETTFDSLAGTVHVVKDVTDKKSVENKIREQNTFLQSLAEDLKKQTEKADNANLAKSGFLATMSHEIRTPQGCIADWPLKKIVWPILSRTTRRISAPRECKKQRRLWNGCARKANSTLPFPCFQHWNQH